MDSKNHGPDVDRPESLEEFRQYHENDKQWAARREFLARHIHNYPGRKTDQLIALSVVWSNIVFIGNRYGEQLTQKVHQMAEGIDIGEIPSFELVPGAKATKRSSSDADGQPSKKKFGPRPRFEPVHFVVSTVEDDKVFQKNREKTANSDGQNECESDQLPDIVPQVPSICVTSNDHSDQEETPEMEPTSSPFIYDPNDTDDKNMNDFGNYLTKMEQNYSAKFESHHSSLGKDFRSNVLDGWNAKVQQGRKGIGFIKPLGKTSGPLNRRSAYASVPQPSLTLEKSWLIKHLSEIVKKHMAKSKNSLANKRVNLTHVLSRCFMACKIHPNYIYVPAVDLPPSIVVKHQVPSDGFACEIRLQDINLATGYSGSKIEARDQAAASAIHLLRKPMVDVTIVQRELEHGRYCSDIVAYSNDSHMGGFLPEQMESISANDNQVGQSSQLFSEAFQGTSSRLWTDFVLTENASDAIGILHNSATINKMKVDYKYDMMPNNVWRCCVYVQGHFLAEGYGNKKNSKHAAAESAVSMIKMVQSNMQNDISPQNPGSGITDLKDLVVYENAINHICTLNDTAQFNKVGIEYLFEKATGMNWKCKVFIEQMFIAEAIGIKKIVKHKAAEAAVQELKKTQPVVVNNMKKGHVKDAISRNQIKGLSNEQVYKQKIKEDNIGNQLLRKMGWTGGGLGKEGEGIAEPISVKEQFSREGLGLASSNQKITKRDIEQMIRSYASSCNQDDLTFSRELTNEERKFIHLVAKKYGLRSKSHGQGPERFLVVSRKRSRQDLLHQLKQEGQVGSYALVMPQN